MQLKYTVLAAALSAIAAADFVIVTRPSIQNIDLSNIQSQVSSLLSVASSRIGDLTKSLPSSEIARASSANSALRNFVSTASLSVPAKVTELGQFEILTATPSWYSALPSDLKSYYDANNAKAQGIANEVAGITSSAAGPSQTGTAAGAKSTGAASAEKVKAYMGVGAAAAFGVFVL
ncbi:hypothetical protein CC86DRAFT_465901 [Ophiobolus disseminans]|uniref:Uncharacterized protein n=1 Tax=Ophiobolus disseminans TaxID=1469910 RepID=A0A6A7A6D0_9PLEO|nr:hypothetical protein CC86DRAFT_465901 [Ophiobolus disseminans]